MVQMVKTRTRLDQLLQHRLTNQAHSSREHQDQRVMHRQVWLFQL